MVRAPCCEKMGLKKGPWTIEEDQILISYIQRCGHGNWRALPKQAGLLRCGKSCRLRWTNYLRPDIKRGNFTIEEEESIIKLHEMLGNRWSTIAARLPGRTDNEIKNVWHTHLKKRRAKNQASPDTKHHYSIEISKSSDINKARESDPMNFATNPIFENSGNLSVSPQRSSSNISSRTDSSIVASENHSMGIEDERTIDSSSEVEVLPDINEDFWTEAFSTEISSMLEDFPSFTAYPQLQFPFNSVSTAEPICNYSSNIEKGMDFWYKVFIEAGELPDLLEF